MTGPTSAREGEAKPGDENEPMLREQTLTTSHGALKLWRGGVGRPLVLLHDLGSDHRSFEELVPQLLERHHVCAVDLLGHGDATCETTDLSIEAQATALGEALVDMDLEEAVLVGHGMGGSVALRTAASHRNRITRLVLLAAGSYPARLPLSWRLLRLRTFWRLAWWLGPKVRSRCAACVTGRPQGVTARWSCVQSRDRWRTLGEAFRRTTGQEAFSEMETLVERYFDLPTLVLWGSEDTVSSPQEARVLFHEKRNARFVEVADGSHTLQEDHPRLTAEMILEFLQ